MRSILERGGPSGGRRSRGIAPFGAGARAALDILLVVLLATTGCSRGSILPAARESLRPRSAPGAQAECLPRFPDQGGWYGGDVAASVALPDGDGRASLWLFGDSFVERPGSPSARTYPFVHNAIALSHCAANGRWRVEFAWGRDAAGSDAERGDAGPRAFFAPDPRAAWVVEGRRASGEEPYYWPTSGAVVEGRVAVALLRVVASPPNGPFRLPFRLVGADLAAIENPDDPPSAWTIRRSTLSSRPDVLPASALVAAGDHLYAFAFLQRGDGRTPRILTRLPLDVLVTERSTLEGAVETLTRDGGWLPGLRPEEARILMADDATEMSVHFDPGPGEWLAVYSSPSIAGGSAASDAILLRRAHALEGPWSEPVTIFRIPELASPDGSPPGEPFCYAGRAHPQFAPSGRLLVTWVCNLFAASDEETPAVLERLRTTPSLYRPRAIRLSVPGTTAGDRAHRAAESAPSRPR